MSTYSPPFSDTPVESPLRRHSAGSLLQTSGTGDDEEQFFQRCRRAILRLSSNLLHAAEQRTEFAPFLLEAMHNAMTNLLEYGDERDLLLLEQWLDEENAD